jgi:amidase
LTIEEYASCDAAGLAALIRKKAISAEEVLEAAVSAIEAINPHINAISFRAYDLAKRQIEDGLDMNAPFAGVPLLLKDSGPLAKGIPATAGSRLIQGQRVEEDTELVRRFKKAGFVIVGTTTTPECCFTNTTESVLHGATRNPWSSEYSTGGSSGGSAAAVASGMVPVAHGNDGGGSIRQPASCCGVVGLKPSRFRIPNAPGHGDPLSGLGTSFALVRTIRDAALLLDTIHGPDCGYYGYAMPPERPYGESIASDPGTLRIAYFQRYPLGGDISGECRESLTQTLALLVQLGHRVTEAYPVVDPRIHDARVTIQAVHTAQQLEEASAENGRPINNEFVEEMILHIYRMGKAAAGSDFLGALQIINTISRDMGRFMEDYDIILCPTMGVLPPKIGEIDANVHPEWNYEEWKERKGLFSHFTNLFNVTGQPSISIPLCMSKPGLPVGMELSGKPGDEATVLSLAAQLERARDWKKQRPGIVGVEKI